MATGWVRFHRKIEEWEWYSDANTFRLFFHLVMKANHKDVKWQGIDIKRGQHLTSSDTLANDLKLTRQQIRTSLNKLKSTNEITIKTTSRFTLVTIENYNLYQSEEKETTNEITKDSTNGQPTDNQQITTNKNDKNDKNDKNEKKQNKPCVSIDVIEEIWAAYPRKVGKASALKTIPKLLEKYTKEQLIQSAKDYNKSVKDKTYLAHGSTFFNGLYLDFIKSDSSNVVEQYKPVEFETRYVE